MGIAMREDAATGLLDNADIAVERAAKVIEAWSTRTIHLEFAKHLRLAAKALSALDHVITEHDGWHQRDADEAIGEVFNHERSIT